MDTLALIRGIRFIDSLFPSGGYAFSSGLEAAVDGGAVTDSAGLERYVADLLQHGTGRLEAVALALAHEAASAGRLESALKIDHELEAMKLCGSTRRASRQMGRQVIRIAAESDDAPLLQRYRHAVERRAAPGHLAVGLGLTLAISGWTKADAVAIFLYQTCAGLLSAGMKLLPIGQAESQRILAGLTPVIDRTAKAAVMQHEMVSFVPLQDIYAMRHSQLASRLFRS